MNSIRDNALHDFALIADCLWLREYRGFVN